MDPLSLLSFLALTLDLNGSGGSSSLGRRLLLDNRGGGRGRSVLNRSRSRIRLGGGHRDRLGRATTTTTTELSHEAIQLIEIHSLGSGSRDLLNPGRLQKEKGKKRKKITK